MIHLGATTRIAVGEAVSFCVPKGAVCLLGPEEEAAVSPAGPQNRVTGVIEGVTRQKDAVDLSLRRPQAEGCPPLYFSVPHHVAEARGLAPGARVTVSLIHDAIHLMPPESPPGPV
jgi:hypothetical protein